LSRRVVVGRLLGGNPRDRITRRVGRPATPAFNATFFATCGGLTFEPTDDRKIMKHEFNELRLERVTRRFAGGGGKVFNALDELTLTIRRGEFIALLGPSGCGKSTALNCIAGLLPLSGGTIRLDDERIDTLPPERRGFGMVFQNYALFPHMSVVKNIGFGLRMQGVPAVQVAPRVEKAMRLVQLTGQEHKLPGQLSGGQQQRVAIARAIVIEPPLILMDEPLSNLDAKLRLETRSEIRRIHRELGRATIYVTHDQDEALSLADRIVVMKDGVVQQIAHPAEVYGQPANLHVARFMGYRNVLHADVVEESGGRVTVEAPDVKLTGVAKLPLSGRRASVAIRPEEMTIATAPGAENVIAGRVDNVEYGGRDSLVDVVTRSGTRLHVRAPVNVALGAEVLVHVPAERVLVYPAETA
jgi:putative spermidine/putrescine transport system ATP-binding protein